MSYKQLTASDRGKLEVLLSLNMDFREIAKCLNRHRSTIYREVKRNSVDGVYLAEKAEHLKISRNSEIVRYTKCTPELLTFIGEKIRATWSPEQIENRCLKGKVSFRSIYRWIYAGKIENCNAKSLRFKGKRRKTIETRGTFSKGKSISQRPEEVNTRNVFGHWELDSMVSGQGKKGSFSTFIERKSRFYVAYIGQDRSAQTMENAIEYLYSQLPAGAFLTATTDRGKEFACHQRVKNRFNIDMYFADAHAPWQRGSNENANGLLREFYPKQTNLTDVEQEELGQKLKLINNRPRKCLGWKTPTEVFLQEVSQLS